MTTSLSSQCLECGSECKPHQRFCSDLCYDLWVYGPGIGLQLNPGYSILKRDEENKCPA